MTLRISLVLSSYNGSEYIDEQLDSLRFQDRTFDEVLICDDCSTDGTYDIIRSYIDRFKLEKWSVAVNAVNNGWKVNFHKLIKHATGDLIFLCDQDDVWLPSKVSEMAFLMENHPEIDVLACDVEPFYETGSKKVPNVGNGANDGALLHEQINAKSIYVTRPGCAYCIRKTFANEIEPFWKESWAHDAMLWELSQVKGTLALYDKRLVKFRRHATNASARKKMTREDRIHDVEDLIDRVRLMKRFGLEKKTLEKADELLLDDINSWLNLRISFLKSRGLRGFSSILRHRSFYATWKGLLVDAVLACRG